MSYKMKKGLLMLNDILILRETNMKKAERLYDKFMLEYSEEEVEELCQKLNVEGEIL